MFTKQLSLKGSSAYVLKDVSKVSLFVFLLSISAHVRVYLPYSPVPLTFETLVLFISPLFLGRMAFFAVGGWVLLGLFGIPVFAGGKGFVFFLGPSGGYVVGFLFAALVLPGFLSISRGFLKQTAVLAAANVLIYITGVAGLMLSLKISFVQSVIIGVVPFIYGDILKIVLASLALKTAAFKKGNPLRDKTFPRAGV